MKDFLPLFPLKLIVFPGEKLNLHIFEPRYKQLIRECEENGITFGLPAFIDQKVMDFGTEIKLLKISKVHENGELDIETEGIGIFKIEEFYSIVSDKLYSGADITRLKENMEGDEAFYTSISNSIRELFEILNIEKDVPSQSDNFNSYGIAHHLGLSLQQEYELLCLPTELERQIYIMEHLKRMIPIVKDLEKLKAKAKMNGHFKKVLPPDFLIGG